MADKYRTFAELLKKTREGTHWRVVSKDRASGILVAAPHGGRAEPYTAAVAKAIAGTSHSLYIFETRVPGLHITSHRFKEHRAVDQASRHSKVLTVHGCDNNRSKSVDVYVGGLDLHLRDRVIAELQRSDFSAAVDTWTPGRAQGNICNSGSSRCGVQLEITRRLRNRLGIQDGGKARRRAFAKAIRRALENKTA
jgi:phage replication-related protein YjqB (UPF0714/DUF867 family)